MPAQLVLSFVELRVLSGNDLDCFNHKGHEVTRRKTCMKRNQLGHYYVGFDRSTILKSA
jgi:hypothetical protein